MNRLALLLLAAALPGLAQTTVGSRLLDWKGAPIAGAEVHLRNKYLTTRTDAQGRFSFNLDPVRVKPVSPALRGPVLEHGSGWFDFLGRRQRGTAASMPLPALLAKTSAGAADLDLLIKARGFDDREILVKEPARLDTLIRLEGRGISIKSPVAAVSCSLGHTLRFFAVHRDSTRRMRIELDSTGEGKWFLPAAPACFVETRFQDTCRFVVPAKLAIPRAGGKADTLRPPGHQLRYRVVEIGADSVQATSPHPLTVLKKIEPEIHLAFEAEVSIKDTFTVKAALRDPLGETLQMFWRMGGARFPNVAGTGTFTAPAQADTLEVDFVAIRPDGSEYSKTALVKVVLDRPVILNRDGSVIPLNQATEVPIEVQNRYGTIRSYQYDVGLTGTWVRTTDPSVKIAARPDVERDLEIGVRATDDDGQTGEGRFKVHVGYPILSIPEAHIHGVVPLSGGRTLFAGISGAKILVGTADSLGRLIDSREWSSAKPWMVSEFGVARIVLNRDGGATIVARAERTQTESDFKVLRVGLDGDSLGESSFRVGAWTSPQHVLQDAAGDYLIAFGDLGVGTLARTDAKGVLRWKKTYPVFAEVNHVHLLANGNLLLTGEAKFTDPEFRRGALAEITPAGDTVWTKVHAAKGHAYLRAFPTTGGFRILSKRLIYDPIMGIDFPGKGLWTYRVDARGAMLDSLVHAHADPVRVIDAIRTKDGGTLVLGYVEEGTTFPYQHLFAKLTATGTLAWKKTHNVIALSEVISVHETSDGGFMGGGRASLDLATFQPLLLPLTGDGLTR